MHKAGFRWSGKEKIQAYQCPECGHVTTTENFAPTSEGQFDQFRGQQPTQQYPQPQPQPRSAGYQPSSFETYT